MWAIRILSGPQSGALFPLQEGEYIVGRMPNCDIQINSQGVSKQHCKIVVRGDKVYFSDLNSSNGTFVNGVRIQDAILNNGDKFSFYNIMGDLQYGIIPQQQNPSQPQSSGNWDSNAAPDMNYQNSPRPNPIQQEEKIQAPKNLSESIQQYIDKVVLPGVYQLGHSFEMKWLLGSFVVLFILLVTILSIIPMSQITKRSVFKESERRALSIARQIVRTNRSAVASNQRSNLYVSFARKEDGVLKALIVSARDGSVWAPATEGNFSNQSFIAEAIKETREFTQKISDTRIGVSVPFIGTNEQGLAVNIAYAIVIYDIQVFKADDQEVFSLLFQTLVIAIALGLIIYFFMYQLIERPIKEVRINLEKAMQEGSSNIETKFIFPALKALLVPINSLLAKAPGTDFSGDNGLGFIDRHSEANGIVQITQNAAIAIGSDLQIMSLNSSFEEFCGISRVNLESQDIESLYDTSLIMNIKDLIERSGTTPNQVHTNEIPMNGVDYTLDIQAIQSDKGVEYFIITALQLGGD